MFIFLQIFKPHFVKCTIVKYTPLILINRLNEINKDIKRIEQNKQTNSINKNKNKSKSTNINK